VSLGGAFELPKGKSNMRLHGPKGEDRVTKKDEGSAHHRCPPHSNSGLVSFFSSFFQPVSFHVNTLNSLTSWHKSGICLAAKASSVNPIMKKMMSRPKDQLRTIFDRHRFVNVHWGSTIDLLVQRLHVALRRGETRSVIRPTIVEENPSTPCSGGIIDR
jgi:hypothetical protein